MSTAAKSFSSAFPPLADERFRAIASVAVLAAYCSLLFLPNLGARDLTSSHEARAAQDAQMILDEGHWLVPRLFDRHLELQKPPLYYWLVAVIAWVKGGPVDVWAVRLPAALSAIVCVLFLYLLGVRTARPRAGLLAGFILASSLHFTWLAQVGRIDMPLTMTVTVALGSFYLGNREPTARWRWHALGYVALGLGLLLKGPIAVVLPAIVVIAAALRRRMTGPRLVERWSVFATMLWGVPLMLALAAPWYLWANWRTGNQLWEVFFWYHNVERGLGGSETLKAHPWWFYGAQAAFDLLPWSVAVPGALWWLIRNRDLRRDDAALGLIWFGAIALFLSCMSFKRADYLLPAFPGLAIFLGACGDKALAGASDAGRGRAIPVALLAVLLAYLGGWMTYNAWFGPAEEKTWAYRDIAKEIRRQTNGPVIFFRAESHVLMFHVGQPVDTILEWENLDTWSKRPRPVYIVMPQSCADEWRDHLPDGSLEEVLRTSDFVSGKRDRPLVVLRNRVQTGAHASR